MSNRSMQAGMFSYLPILTTIREYKRDYISGDVVAGIVVAIMLIPQGMAYALLAGLPPQAGLYAFTALWFIWHQLPPGCGSGSYCFSTYRLQHRHDSKRR